MGVAVESTTNLGHVASIDLTLPKYKTPTEEGSRQVKAEHGPQGRTKVTVEEKKVTTTTFNSEKATVQFNRVYVPLSGDTATSARLSTSPKAMTANYSATLQMAAKTSTPGGSSSIYGLIKKGGTPAAVPYTPKAAPVMNPTRLQKHDDSSSSFDDDTASYTSEEPPKPAMRKQASQHLQHRRSIQSTASSEYR